MLLLHGNNRYHAKEHEYQGTEIAANNTYRAELGLHLYGKSWQETTTGANLVNSTYYFIPQNNAKIAIVNPDTDFAGREWQVNADVENGNRNTGISVKPNFHTENIKFKVGETYTFSGYIKGSFNTLNPVRLIAFYTNTKGQDWVKFNLAEFYVTSKIDEYTRYSLSFSVKDDFDENVNRVVLVFANWGGQFYFTKPMLQKGSTLTNYEPYTGGIPSPNPDYPQPINSIGDSGSVDVVVSDNNGNSQTLTINTPNGLCGIPVDTGGNYTDSTGQQWVCDEVDFKRGVFVQRIGKIASYNNEQLSTKYMSTTGKLTTGAIVIYILATPIETPLTAAELAAYKAIKSYPHYTHIKSASELKVKLKIF
mgnify:FL=1|jgi:hypothetical protein